MFFVLKEFKIFTLMEKSGAAEMNKVKIHVVEEISFVRESEFSDEDKELFSIFLTGSHYPYFPEEDGKTFFANDYEICLARKESYVIKYGGLVEFEKALNKHLGYVPYA